ncbi:MAG: universal stress protein [Chlamydiota bacterium]
MHRYNHILVACDLINDDDRPVIERAIEISKASGAKVSLLHVIEDLYNYGSPWEIENNTEWQMEFEKNAAEKLTALALNWGIPSQQQIIAHGPIRSTIHQVAANNQADLIIVGSHGKHGLGLLLFGSTANSVLHHTTCDVLAVHVSQSSEPEQ